VGDWRDTEEMIPLVSKEADGVGRAIEFFKRGNFKDATTLVEQALRINPEDREAKDLMKKLRKQQR